MSDTVLYSIIHGILNEMLTKKKNTKYQAYVSICEISLFPSISLSLGTSAHFFLLFKKVAGESTGKCYLPQSSHTQQ